MFELEIKSPRFIGSRCFRQFSTTVIVFFFSFTKLLSRDCIFFTREHPLNNVLRACHPISERSVTGIFRFITGFFEGGVGSLDRARAIRWSPEVDTTRSRRRIVSRTECRGRLRPAGAAGGLPERSRNAPRMRASDIRPHCPPCAASAVVPCRPSPPSPLRPSPLPPQETSVHGVSRTPR